MGLTPGSKAIRGSVPVFISFRLMKHATNMGLTPGSRAIRGSVLIFLSFRLMKQIHLETTSVGHDSLSGRVSSSLLQVPCRWN